MKARLTIRSVAVRGSNLEISARGENAWHSDPSYVIVLPAQPKVLDTYRVGREIEVTVVPK